MITSLKEHVNNEAYLMKYIIKFNVGETHNHMSWQAHKLPDLYQEGTYKKQKAGKTFNVGKPIKTSPCNASVASGSTSEWAGPVPLQHFGEQNDMDTSLDCFNLNPHLSTQEEVRHSYGKVGF